MKVKHVVITDRNNTIEFFLPGVLDSSLIVEYIRAIRMGDRRNWERKFRDLPLTITEEESAVFDTEMKYIVLGDRNQPLSEEIMMIFPKTIDHDRFMEVMRMMMLKQETIGGENYSPINKMSAGFVEDDGYCYGRSETLGISSREEDSNLFKKWFA